MTSTTCCASSGHSARIPSSVFVLSDLGSRFIEPIYTVDRSITAALACSLPSDIAGADELLAMRHSCGTELVSIDTGAHQGNAVARIARVHERDIVCRQRVGEYGHLDVALHQVAERLHAHRPPERSKAMK